MADTKISALTELAAADVDTAADVLPIVDTGATTTKKITVDNLRTTMGPKLATEQATTSGTSIDFTGVPSWVKRITVMFEEVSTSGTSNLLIQVGDSGGVEVTAYVSSSARIPDGSSPVITSSTAGFVINQNAATFILSGHMVLTLSDSTNNTWIASHYGKLNTSQVVSGGGSKSLSATLDRIRLTTVNGTDTFDAGAINVMYE